jgi:hypothetical protein
VPVPASLGGATNTNTPFSQCLRYACLHQLLHTSHPHTFSSYIMGSMIEAGGRRLWLDGWAQYKNGSTTQHLRMGAGQVERRGWYHTYMLAQHQGGWEWVGGLETNAVAMTEEDFRGLPFGG